jgi:hypothetical protein
MAFTYLGFPGNEDSFKESIQEDWLATQQRISETGGPCYYMVTADQPFEKAAPRCLPKAVSSGSATRDRDRLSTKTSDKSPTWQGL